MRLYEEVPIANYAVVLPESKLTFRGTDALRLDAVTLLSLSVLFVQFFVRRIGSGAAPGGAQLAEDGATSDRLSEQFAAHDSWVQSLKDSAEEVLRRHKETRSAFAAAGIAPSP